MTVHAKAHLTSPHLTSPHSTSPHLTSPHLTLPYLHCSHQSLAGELQPLKLNSQPPDLLSNPSSTLPHRKCWLNHYFLKILLGLQSKPNPNNNPKKNNNLNLNLTGELQPLQPNSQPPDLLSDPLSTLPHRKHWLRTTIFKK